MTRPATRTPLLPPRAREALSTTVYVIRHVSTAVFFVIAAVIVVAHFLLWKIDIVMDGDVYAWSFAMTVAAAGLGWLCLPDRRPLPRLRRRPAVGKRLASSRAAGPLLVDAGHGQWGVPLVEVEPGRWDAEAAELERLWEGPTLLPPHEHRIRPATPAADEHERERGPSGGR